MNKTRLMELWIKQGYSIKALKHQKVVGIDKKSNAYIFLNKKHGILTFIREGK